MMMARRFQGEQGQAYVIGAVALAGIVVLIIFLIRIALLFVADAFLQQRVDFAAAAGARADGDALVSGAVEINQSKATSSVRAELLSSFTQLEFVGATAQQMIDNTTIEFVDPPPDGSCQIFPGDSVCYTVPAVRVTSTIPFDLYGITINLTRQGVATIAANPGAGGNLPTIPTPTPIVLPTEVIYPTP